MSDPAGGAVMRRLVSGKGCGARGLKEADLARAYRSQVDPRLNYEQALELAMLIARHKSPRR